MAAQVLDVVFYDGVVSKPWAAQISPIDDQSVLIRYGDALQKQRRYDYAAMTLVGALGKIQPVIELSDDARIEFSQVLPEWFQLRHKDVHHSIWKLERTPSLIVFSLVFVLLMVFATIQWGIPSAAKYVAYQLPASSLQKIGNEAEHYILEMTQPSQLSQARQQQILASYQKLIAGDAPAKVLFRHGESLGANALAIPNNTIILTDELVALAQNDQEVVAVLAHEQGHLVERHSLQQALSSLGFSIILLAITGDGTDLISALPVALVGANYSRNFESDADHYALKTMQQQGIPTIHLANFLERLAQDTGEDSQAQKSPLDFLQSHPATQKRIQAIKEFEQMQHATP